MWQPPPASFLKLNFDKASMGDLGLASFEGVFRDDNGHIIHIYVGNLGTNTNNVVELSSLEQGPIIAKHLNYQKL